MVIDRLKELMLWVEIPGARETPPSDFGGGGGCVVCSNTCLILGLKE